jgi:hypothetical protein
MLTILLAAMILPAPSTPVQGQETVITSAANGGLRDWERGPEPDTLLVRDRTERWYRIVLSGDCPSSGSLDALTYTTDVTGRFDRFSRLRFLRYPNVICGVRSITRSAPPLSRQTRKPGARR